VFWNKEDGVHFDRFIDSATLFDVVLTVDENCLARYRERLETKVKLGVMPFAVQPAFHHPVAEPPPLRRANFVGSYSHHIHDRRRGWQDTMFRACEPLGLTVYDRISDRKATHYRYPPLPWMDVRPSVPYAQTADIYRQHAVSLNVNTVDDSPSMFSRRLIEIVACGGLAVTNPSPSVDRYFKDYVQVVHNEEECREVLGRIARDGLSKQDRERALAGAEYVRQNHTWAHRLQQIAEVVGI
jgi:spore maturation protein CgeB